MMLQIPPIRWRIRPLLLCALASITGCSSARPPTDIIEKADATLTRAVDAKANALAPLELYVARDTLNRARRAANEEDYEKAGRLAERALVDAQLAEAKARAVRARRDVQELRATVESLRREPLRQPASP